MNLKCNIKNIDQDIHIARILSIDIRSSSVWIQNIFSIKCKNIQEKSQTINKMNYLKIDKMVSNLVMPLPRGRLQLFDDCERFFHMIAL